MVQQVPGPCLQPKHPHQNKYTPSTGSGFMRERIHPWPHHLVPCLIQPGREADPAEHQRPRVRVDVHAEVHLVGGVGALAVGGPAATHVVCEPGEEQCWSGGGKKLIS